MTAECTTVAETRVVPRIILRGGRRGKYYYYCLIKLQMGFTRWQSYYNKTIHKKYTHHAHHQQLHNNYNYNYYYYYYYYY
jgi:hypothetical protein